MVGVCRFMRLWLLCVFHHCGAIDRDALNCNAEKRRDRAAAAAAAAAAAT